jgi:hypothetical protein
MTESSQSKLPPRKAKVKAKPKSNFSCNFCKRGFVREDSLLVHVCEQKRRFLQRDEKPNKLGFMAYQQFFMRSMRHREPPSYEKFAKSTLYLAFVRFGRHMMELNAVNPLGFVDFLLRLEAPIDRWISPTLYETYIRELNKNETPLDALERSFSVMQHWASDTGEKWQDFFRLIDVPLAALYIANGRISPWVLFIATTAHDLMQRFNPEQEALIDRCVDADFWRLKIQRHRADVETIREVLAEHGI